MLQDEYNKLEDQIAQASRRDNWRKFGHFNEIQFSRKDWMMINNLNEALKVRYVHTSVHSNPIQII